MRQHVLRSRWADDEPALGGWLTLPDSFSAEIVARHDLDYLCIDTQHGMIDYSAGWKLLQAVNLGDATPVVRVPWNEPGIIGKSLDAGARAIIVPMVNSRTEAAAAVRACRYAPAGSRSFGPIRATRQEGADYYRHANDDVVVIPMIETAKAVADLDDILSVPGVDAIYVGPADLSVSLGLPPGNNDDEPAFVEAYETIVKGCRDHGVVPGCHASAELCARRIEQGFRMITITSDALALARATGEDVAMARGATSGPGAEIY